MSPFAQIAQLVNEPSLPQDELRIIAKDKVGPLKSEDREALIRAADEIELFVKHFHATHAELLRTKAELQALRDRQREGHAVVFPSIQATLNPAYARLG